MKNNLKPFVFVLSAVVAAAAAFPGYGSNITLVAVHLLFPLFWGIALPLFWPRVRLIVMLLLLATVILASAAAREAILGLIYGWQYISVNDLVARYFLLYSVGAQFIVALVAFASTALFTARRRAHGA